MDLNYAKGPATDTINAFKQKLFGDESIHLHTADITRNRNGFERLKEPAFRAEFYQKLNALMQTLEYEVIGCAIKKEAHLQRYGLAALDPYMLSLDVLVERFCMMIGDVEGGGMIIAEKRDSTLDRQLEIAWLNLKVQGTRFMQATQIERRIQSLILRDKKANIGGIQLADLVVTPIGRKVLNKPSKEDYKIVESKMRRSPSGRIDGYGLVVLPKEKRPTPATQ
ncbi:MAG TPA: DUF3800 domain-containing protein [Opitutae bacterium]|nr:DUF3800 domain-containing protein [Opitutae bacterium]